MERYIKIKQGTKRVFTVDVSAYPTQGLTWNAALVNPSTNKRYVASIDAASTTTTKIFYFPDGLTTDSVTGALVKDDTVPNGTAHMSVGVYNFEVYPADRSDMGFVDGLVSVLSSNFMTNNTEE